MNNYAVRNLSSSLENMKENIVKSRALEIIQYQNFKTRIAVEHLKHTRRAVFDSAVGYIKYGTWNKCLVTKELKEELDKLIANHVQPLTPKQDEKRVCYNRTNKVINKHKKYQEKDVIVPISKLEVVNQQMTEEFEYGVRQGDNIRLFANKELATSFIESVKFFTDKEVKLVEVTINEGDNE